MTPLSSQSYTFDPRPNYALLITAKRYWNPSSPSLSDPNALTLIFTHGTGFHKEQWEPAIDDLYNLLDMRGSATVREIWSIDAPNHGDAAILNEKALTWGYHPIFGWEEYGRSIHALLAGLGTGIDVDFSSRRLVGIGHSMGAVSLILSTTYQPSINFTSLILVELMTMSQKYVEKMGKVLVGGAINRRDIWPSREEAFKLLQSRPAWKVWDKRVLKIYVEEGLRPLPTIDYPNNREGVTLKCSRIQETASALFIYSIPDSLGSSRAYLLLSTIVKRFPTHMIYGAIDDYLPQAVKDDVLNKASGGIENFASLVRVEGSGHLVVQVKPKGLAQKIHDALLHPSTAPELQAKL